MILLEEHWINAEFWNRLAHVRLTDATFTLSAILVRWVLIRIPITAIRDVQLQKHRINDEILISYFNERDAFKTLSFSTTHAEHWSAAFQRLGVQRTHLN